MIRAAGGRSAARETSAAASVLARPFTLACGVTIRNRLLKSAMSEALGGRDGAPPPALARLYAAWADGGIGLSVTGNVMIDACALGEPGNVVIEDDRHLAGLAAWANAATRDGAHCWVQLNHPGRQAPRGLNRENVAPSAVPFSPAMRRFFATPRELTDAEVRSLIERFARAAGVVRLAGFTGVQIHGAHGYLVSQFLSPLTNRRDDHWGGTPAKRRRFPLAVLSAMRARVGDGFPIGIKLNSADFQRGGFDERESLDTLRALADHGIDLIEISGGTYEAPAMTGVRASTVEREAYFLEFAQQARRAVSLPLAVTGGFRTASGMARAIESGAVDFVGLARPLALEPDLPARVLRGDSPRLTVRPIRTGLAPVDRSGLLEIAWYTAQLKRIGAGRPPRPDASPWRVLLGLIARRFRPGGGRAPPRLRGR